MSLTEKITDFETKGLSWLEPAREFVKSLNQAANLIQTDNLSELPTFLKNIGSNHILRNREFLFAPKNPYNLVAERRVSRREALTFPTWCPGWDSNPQGFWPQHFKCCVYTYSTTRACLLRFWFRPRCVGCRLWQFGQRILRFSKRLSCRSPLIWSSSRGKRPSWVFLPSRKFHNVEI